MITLILIKLPIPIFILMSVLSLIGLICLIFMYLISPAFKAEQKYRECNDEELFSNEMI